MIRETLTKIRKDLQEGSSLEYKILGRSIDASMTLVDKILNVITDEVALREYYETQERLSHINLLKRVHEADTPVTQTEGINEILSYSMEPTRQRVFLTRADAKKISYGHRKAREKYGASEPCRLLPQYLAIAFFDAVCSFHFFLELFTEGLSDVPMYFENTTSHDNFIRARDFFMVYSNLIVTSHSPSLFFGTEYLSDTAILTEEVDTVLEEEEKKTYQAGGYEKVMGKREYNKYLDWEESESTTISMRAYEYLFNMCDRGDEGDMLAEK